MKKSKKNFNHSLTISIIFVILGLFLFIKPDATINTISYIFGVFLLILGIISIFKYFKYEYEINTLDFDLVYGVLVSISGIYLIINPVLLATIFPTILGIWIIVNSVTKFQYALLLKKLNKNDFKYILIISLLAFILGIVLLINPLKTVLVVTQIIGIFIIIYAVLDIIDNFILRRNKDDFNKFYIVKEIKNDEK